MVEKIGNTLLNNYSVADDWYMLVIDNDNSIDEAIADWLDSIWWLVRHYIISNLQQIIYFKKNDYIFCT